MIINLKLFLLQSYQSSICILSYSVILFFWLAFLYPFFLILNIEHNFDIFFPIHPIYWLSLYFNSFLMNLVFFTHHDNWGVITFKIICTFFSLYIFSFFFHYVFFFEQKSQFYHSPSFCSIVFFTFLNFLILKTG